MKSSKKPSLKLNSRTLVVFENKDNGVKYSNTTTSDPTTGTATLTGFGIYPSNLKSSPQHEMP